MDSAPLQDAMRTEATIESLQQALRDGSSSSVAVVEHCLARIKRWDRNGPRLAAMLAVNPDARRYAAELDASFQASGKLRGPLHGVPVILKDNCNTTSMPTTAASAALAGFTPSQDCAVARRLIAAGAILLGKANLHEFAAGGLTVSSLGGQTRNPYDLTRTPGGSSGGSAVAVAMDFCTVAIGTDTVNSIRSPASANCLVGLRPTRGLVSRAGVIPVSETQDTVGPMARTVGDVARVMDVLAGYDPNDPVTAHSVGRVPASYTDSLEAVGLRGCRLGLLADYQGAERRHEEVNRAMADAIEVLTQAGAEITSMRASFPDADTLIQHFDVQKWEFKAQLNSYLSQEPQAPVKDLAGILATGGFHRETLQEFLEQAEHSGDGTDDVDYLSRRLAHGRLRDQVLALMAEHKLDALLYPLQKSLVAPVGSAGQPDRNGILAALTGLPALNLPAGFSTPTATAPLGIPIGFDLLARPFDEPLLLRMGYAYEQAARVRRPPDESAWET